MTTQAERGFTLFETLVAFAILSVSLVSIFELWTGSVRRSAINTDRERALNVAQSLLDEELALRIGAAGQRTGTAETDLNWRVERSLHPISQPTVGFAWTQMDVVVTVDWTSIAGPDSVRLDAVMLVPQS